MRTFLQLQCNYIDLSSLSSPEFISIKNFAEGSYSKELIHTLLAGDPPLNNRISTCCHLLHIYWLWPGQPKSVFVCLIWIIYMLDEIKWGSNSQDENKDCCLLWKYVSCASLSSQSPSKHSSLTWTWTSIELRLLKLAPLWSMKTKIVTKQINQIKFGHLFTYLTYIPI